MIIKKTSNESLFYKNYFSVTLIIFYSINIYVLKIISVTYVDSNICIEWT